MGTHKKKGDQETESASGLPLQAVYSQDSPESLEPPGQFPYRRGIHESMYRGRLWTMRQYAGFGSASEANTRYRMLLAQGAAGLSVAFDLPTQMGRDPDHAAVQGEVGRVGVSIARLEDMRELLAGIPLESVSVSMTINSTAPILLAFLMLVAEEQGCDPARLRGTTQNDILKEYIARGTYIYPPAAGLRLATDLISYTSRHLPEWNPISISGYHIREAGSNAIEELAFTFANAITYVEHLQKRGVDIASFIASLSFFFNAHQDFFEEIAKFRAAREIWAYIVRDRFCISDPQLARLRFHTQTAGSSLTAQQPLHNLVRTTYEALSAVLGGTQSLHTNAYDEALGLPTEQSALLALRTQQILAHETEIPQVADPLGGSFFMENLTEKIRDAARKHIEEVFERGGVLAGIEQGYFQDKIEASAFRYQNQLEKGERRIVGVNIYAEEEQEIPGLTRIDAEIERKRAQTLTHHKASARPQVKIALDALHQAALLPHAELFPHILACAREGASLGEISDSLRAVFGEYHP